MSNDENKRDELYEFNVQTYGLIGTMYAVIITYLAVSNRAHLAQWTRSFSFTCICIKYTHTHP